MAIMTTGRGVVFGAAVAALLGGAAAAQSLSDRANRRLVELVKLKIEPTTFEQPVALAKLRAGEIAALAYVVGKPAPAFAALRPDDKLHFLAVPLPSEIVAAYVPSRLTAEDYPGLVAPDAPVDTVAVGTAMLAANL